jgi:hypothetical protein
VIHVIAPEVGIGHVLGLSERPDTEYICADDMVRGWLGRQALMEVAESGVSEETPFGTLQLLPCSVGSETVEGERAVVVRCGRYGLALTPSGVVEWPVEPAGSDWSGLIADLATEGGRVVTVAGPVAGPIGPRRPIPVTVMCTPCEKPRELPPKPPNGCPTRSKCPYGP